MGDIRVLLGVDQEFQPLLLESDRSEVGSAVLGWLDSGLTARMLRGRKMRTLSGLFDEFAAALQFPIYFGENMDAFDECMADLEYLPAGEGYVMVILEPDQVLADAEVERFVQLLGSLKAAATEWARPVDLGEWWDRPAIPFHVVLAGGQDEIDIAADRWSKTGLTMARLHVS